MSTELRKPDATMRASFPSGEMRHTQPPGGFSPTAWPIGSGIGGSSESSRHTGGCAEIAPSGGRVKFPLTKYSAFPSAVVMMECAECS